MELKLKFLPHGLHQVPSYATPGAAALDLHAAVPGDEPLLVQPTERYKIPTGIIVAVPEGYEGTIRARSGRAYEEGLILINGIGTLDSDYRGEIFVLVTNLSNWHIKIKRGERIAQLVISPIVRVDIVVVSELEPTLRGAGGLGSTGR